MSGRFPRAPLALLAAALLAGTGARPSPEACLGAGQAAFTATAAAERQALEQCFRGRGPSAGSLAECLAAPADGRVAAARRRALALEARRCDGAPPFGSAGAAAANAAARDAAAALARGLFGLDLDAARVERRADPRGRACQERVLRQAGRCAGAFLDAYRRCAASAVAGGADDAFDLVACKGADASGAIARACAAPLDAAVARACPAERAPALFPGCAGDVAACARGHARRSASLALNDAGALCQDVRAGSLPPETLLQCFEPPPPEPIAWTQVPLPADVSPLTVEWLDDQQLLVSFQGARVAGTQLATLGVDGGGFRCLTCGGPIAGNLRPVQRFRDGARALVAGPNLFSANWRVLECAPSLLDCQSAELVPIQLPANPDPGTGILQYRVPWVTLDDGWLVWSEVRSRGPGGNVVAMGRLVRDASGYTVADARVIVPPFPPTGLGTDPERWRNFTQPFEAKFGGLRGGRDWIVAGTPDAGQYDASTLDLATGELRRLTHHPDHDEGIRFRRDEQWAVLQSARTDERVEFLGLLPRPPYVDWIAFSVHFVGIAGAPSDGISPGTDPDERDCYVDPWLLDRWFERGDYIGQRLLQPAEGWVSIEGNAGGFGWSPDGTRIALIERRWRDAPVPRPTRLRIATLTSRLPVDPAAVVSIAPTPEPAWALRYEDYAVPDTFGTTVVPGRASGTATIRNAMPTATQGEVEVVYDDYSDDGASVLDGFERLRIPRLILEGAVYEVDLTLAGARAGSLRGSIHYDFANDVNTGEVVGELDGRVVRGPRTCYEAGLIPLP
jgi:hypothetical protein